MNFDPCRVLNINVGVLGHVDSGKTSLVKALSTVLSTAALDKHPQSQQRGITLDLGFSSFIVPMPHHLVSDIYDHLQFTLVDCPGHSSLIRTIIGGAQIMDMMILVVDATKGIQAQTLECVVIGEAVMDDGADVIVVLNKVDLFPEEDRAERLKHAVDDIKEFLRGTKLCGASIVSCSAAMSDGRAASSVSRSGLSDEAIDALGTKESSKGEAEGTASTIEGVVEALKSRAKFPNGNRSTPFYFAFDHCFSIQGKGTVLTGTVLGGEVKVNQMVEFPTLCTQKKVKSMQMFRRPVTKARLGDRVGLCIAGLDSKLLERGVVATPGAVKPATTALAIVQKVPVYKGRCQSGAYCHVTLGHSTVRASATFFGAREIAQGWSALVGEMEKGSVGGKYGREESPSSPISLQELSNRNFPWDAEFAQQLELLGENDMRLQHQGSVSQPSQVLEVDKCPLQYCLLTFQKPVMCPPNSILIGSRLDSLGLAVKANYALYEDRILGGGVETESTNCRIAFHGRLVKGSTKYDAGSNGVPGHAFGKERRLKVYTEKEKSGIIFRLGDSRTEGRKTPGRVTMVLGKDLFKRETNMSSFIGMIIQTEAGNLGRLVSSFGHAGKFKVNFPKGTNAKVGEKLLLKFRRYLNDPSRSMNQEHLQKRLNAQPEHPANQTPCLKAPSANVKEELCLSPPILKLREGCIDSLKGEAQQDGGHSIAIVAGLFSQEEDIRELIKDGMQVLTALGEQGYVIGPFGKAGKCKVEFPRGTMCSVGMHAFVP
ncbi:unnamed protein product [Choristocarpus tenellus]